MKWIINMIRNKKSHANDRSHSFVTRMEARKGLIRMDSHIASVNVYRSNSLM